MIFSASNLRKQPFVILATYTTVIIASLLAYGYKLASSNIYNQVPAIISLLNPELYNNDFYIQEMTQFTPRYYYYHLIYWGVKLGFSLPWVCFGLYVIAFSSFLIGLYSLGRIFNQSRLSATVFTFLGFAATVNGRIGHADLFRTDPIPATLAMGLVVWGFYFCFRQKWILGYFFFGLTCLLQFLVGALPGILMAIPLLISGVKNKSFKQIFFSFFALGICASLVYIPMLLIGNTNSGTISNEEFIYLYGYIRHPHHLIFSSFGLTGSRGWLNFILFTVGGLLCIKSSKSLKQEVKLQLAIVILISCFSLVINYIFVEIYPLDFVAKLQFARTTPFAQLMILLGISVLVEEEYSKGNIPIAFLLIIAPILRGAGVLSLILGVSLCLEHRGEYKSLNRFGETESYEKQLDRSPSSLVIFSWGAISLFFLATSNLIDFTIGLSSIVFVILIGYYQPKYILDITSKPWIRLLSLGTLLTIVPIAFFPDGIIVDLFFLLWLNLDKNNAIAKKTKEISIFLFVLFMVLYQHYDLFLLIAIAFPLLIDKIISSNERKRIITFSLAAILTAYFRLSLWNILPPSLTSFWRSRIRINAIADNDVVFLAQKFQQLSSEDAVVLVPPLDERFRFYSQRSVAFTFKSFPFTDAGINIWKNRLETILGTNGFGKYALDTFYSEHSNSDIIAIAREFEAGYILTRLDWHPNLDGRVIAQQGDWIIYQIDLNLEEINS
ncbi:MAG: hypothetical protein QNJ34_01470 [Xenococcaceae cyanobacterium MO_188.B29]|nr:hypothetical protein [Xenococcaceae cyanobacterium MO_188.B29]